jgi:hypothetical protein
VGATEYEVAAKLDTHDGDETLLGLLTVREDSVGLRDLEGLLEAE